ncbi:MAG: pyridoxamine 5'-phosphate oxidase [Hyphomicrobiaceae bacterium]|nr:pyridoxamine 5'-phosphate oxidase [Hyphomicrobiaceae bacterium]MCC0023100.1 pyridoxamine 5'-phosphate oxidase [Hyphomicrobiaceae bacterium]
MSGKTLTERLFDDSQAEKPDPYDLFELWLGEAAKSEINDPIAMSLATVDSDGLPNCRAVLMNRNDRRGFVFFTNSNSAKGEELAASPRAALLFHWKSNRRQVRIRGEVEMVSAAEADEYFASRPRGSQVGAHASNQSHPLESRDTLIKHWKALEDEFEGKAVPRPAHWNGYRIIPQEIEFWENGEFRLHNRVRYLRKGEGWTAERLNP